MGTGYPRPGRIYPRIALDLDEKEADLICPPQITCLDLGVTFTSLPRIPEIRLRDRPHIRAHLPEGQIALLAYQRTLLIRHRHHLRPAGLHFVGTAHKACPESIVGVISCQCAGGIAAPVEFKILLLHAGPVGFIVEHPHRKELPITVAGPG